MNEVEDRKYRMELNMHGGAKEESEGFTDNPEMLSVVVDAKSTRGFKIKCNVCERFRGATCFRYNPGPGQKGLGNLRTHLDKQSHGEAMAEWKGTSSSNGAPHATLIETVSGKLIAEDSNFFSGLVADVGEGILQCTATDCQHGEKAFVFVGKGKMLRNTWNLESNVRQHFQSRAKVGHTNISALKLTTCHQ